MDPVDPKNTKVLYDKIVAGSCSVEFCREWLKSGIDVNHRNSWGITLLIAASEFARSGENQQIVQMLIDDFGADVHFRDDEDGWTALVHAVYDSGRFSTHETVRILIDAGSNVNFQDDDDWTVLIYAVSSSGEYSTEKTVRILIESGADVNSQDTDDGTALMRSVCGVEKYSTKETVRMLIDAGANVSLKSDWYYGSALGCGVRMCKTICATLIVNMLIEAI